MALSEAIAPAQKSIFTERAKKRAFIGSLFDNEFETYRPSPFSYSMHGRISTINIVFGTTRSIMAEQEFTRRYVTYQSKFINKIIEQSEIYKYQASDFQIALLQALNKIALLGDIKLNVSLTEDSSLLFTLMKATKLIYFEYYPKADKEEGEAEVLVTIFEGGKKIGHLECDLEEFVLQMTPYI